MSVGDAWVRGRTAAELGCSAGGGGERDSVLLGSLLTVWAVAAPASAALRPAHRGGAACSVPRAASWGEGGSAAITTCATTNGNSNYTDYTKFLIPAPRN